MVDAASERTELQPTLDQRVVLLGASNAARGIATAVATARSLCGGPFDLLAAIGHGRSYGSGSWVLGRWLPGILQCHLWHDLKQRPAARTYAILTDVGNDVLFGAAPERIALWVRECIVRLQPHECSIVTTGIPLASLARMSRGEFLFFRTIFFPTCRLTFEESIRRATELGERLEQIAGETNCQFVKPLADWYVRDRIHISRAHQAEAWRAFLAPLSAANMPAARPATTAEFFRIRALTPYYRKICGIPQRAEQPAATLRDGTRVSLY